MKTFREYLNEKSYDVKKMKQNRISLTPEERDEVMKAGAVWHNHPNPKYNPVPAVWKTKDIKGNIKYCCNTHRAIAIEDSLKKAIKKFEFIKSTS